MFPGLFFGSAAAMAVPVAASLSSRSIDAFAFSPASAICYYRIGTSGDVTGGESTATFLETWRDAGSNADFEVRATLISGTSPTGTLDTWQDISENRDWLIARSGVGTNQSVIDIEIRNAITLAVLTTARITMSASVEEPL